VLDRLRRHQVLVVVLLFTGYAAYYACRTNLSVGTPLILAELVDAGWSAEDARNRLGTVASVGVFAYAVGKLLGGPTADRLGGRTPFLGGLLGAALCTIAFALSGGIAWFTAAWAVNRLVQAFGWPGLVAVSTRWFSWSVAGTAMGFISLSYLVGDATARLWMGALIDLGWGWRPVFLAAAAIALVTWVLVFFLLRTGPESVGLPPQDPHPDAVSDAPAPWLSTVGSLVQQPAFLAVCGMSIGLTLLRETFNTWTPTYFVQALGLSDGTAGQLSAIFPAMGIVSVLGAGVLGDRQGRGGRARVLLVGVGASTLCLGVLGLLGVAAGPWVAVPVVGLVGLLLVGPYSYLAGAVAMDFGGRRGAGTASALIDASGYLAGILAGEGVSRLAGAMGWGPAFLALAAVSAATTAVAAAYAWSTRQKPAPLSPT
jgi:OPA family glycerol-3-phosphate transporter-like MFS transporter